MTGYQWVGAMGIAVLLVSAWLSVKGEDGDGWALLAFLLIVTSCSASPP